MTEESTAPDLVELNRQAIEAVARRDFDAATRSYGPASVWEMGPAGLGTLQGVAAIRAALDEWTAIYEDVEVEIAAHLHLGDGDSLAVVLQRGAIGRSTGY